MHLVTIQALPALLLPLLGRAVAQHGSAVPGAYIVEFENSHADPLSTFYSNLTSTAISASPNVDLSFKLFRGASFRLNHDAEEWDAKVAEISSMGVVKRISPVRVVSAPSQVDVSGIAPGNQAVLQAARRAAYVETYAPHVMSGVDKLHAEGYTGKGMFVAIVDSGVDYYHPTLGGGFGPGFKIAHGYDFAGDDYTGFNTPVPDNDPLSTCNGHGTFVTGVVGASPNSYNFTGIVPDATLGMYRVAGCGPVADASSDVLIAAFNMAYEDGADVITCSYYTPFGWSDDPWDIAIARIIEAGTPCINCAGNDGTNGLFTAATGSNAIGDIGVGWIDSIINPSFHHTGVSYTYDSTNSTSNNTSSQEFIYALGSKKGVFPTVATTLWALDYDTSNPADGCAPFPADTPDLSSKIVLLRRGGCDFEVKGNNTAQFGGRYLVIYDNIEQSPIPFVSDYAPIDGLASITPEQGASWIESLQAGFEIQILMNVGTKYTEAANNITGGYMSPESSWGPTNDLTIKPEVSAPGGNIFSTYPLELGGYRVQSGTSYSTPFVAGVVALIKQVRGDLSPDEIRSLVSNTAKPVNFNDGTATQYEYFAPVVQQGGGLIDAYAAAHVKTTLRPNLLSLNDTVHFSGTTVFEITNNDTVAVTYTFGNVDAAVAYTFAEDSIFVSPSPGLTTGSTTITFLPPALTIQPGTTSKVEARLTPPDNLNHARFPIYSGYIQINGTNGDLLTLPFAGLGADMGTATIVDTADGYPYLGTDVNATSIPANTVFTISNLANATTPLPTIYVYNAFQTYIFDVNLIPADSPPSYGTTGEESLVSIGQFPSRWSWHNSSWTATFNGTLSSGGLAASGNYSFLLRALKNFGNTSLLEDWEVHRMVPFIWDYEG